MRILFLGDVVGISGCSKLMNSLMDEIKSKKIDFVIVNGENAASQGVGLTKEICLDFFNCGVDVITTGNHVWDQKEIMEYIDKENRLLRPKNLFEPAPGKGFNIYNTKKDIKIGVLNLMGNVFMKKCEDVFEISEKFTKQYKLKNDYDLLVVDFHGEITSEKNAIGHFFDGKASLVVGTHTHIPTNDARILTGGTAYQTDAGMCGDYNSVIGMNVENSINRFLKKNSIKHFPAIGDATLCGVIVDCNIQTGLATNIESYVFGAQLKNTH
jgi:metallophosphoesterase (TIGR00282 family)